YRSVIDQCYSHQYNLAISDRLAFPCHFFSRMVSADPELLNVTLHSLCLGIKNRYAKYKRLHVAVGNAFDVLHRIKAGNPDRNASVDKRYLGSDAAILLE